MLYISVEPIVHFGTVSFLKVRKFRVLGTSLTSKRKCRLKIAKMKKVILFAMLAIFQNVTHFPVLAILQKPSLTTYRKKQDIAPDL